MEKYAAPADAANAMSGLNPRDALDILEIRARETQQYLAQHADVEPDVLHYLATQGAPATRQAVAANVAAPAVVNRLLADDPEDDVRAELAAKIARLMPGLELCESDHIVALTIATLERLAHDSSAKVRAILAEEIKHLDCIPRSVVQTLARDLDIIVSAPILEYSPLLSDTDLMEVIACGQVGEALSAIARRRPLGPAVCDQLVQSLDVSAVATLLVNPDAKIRKETLERIVADAKEIDAWHLPLALRTDLSQRAIRRIGGFVGAALIERLAARAGLSESCRLFLMRQLRKRLDGKDGASERENAARIVAEAQAKGRLDGSYVEDAVLAGQREIVIVALAMLARAPVESVRRIMASGNPKPLVALVWRAQLTMRIAFKIQTHIMKLSTVASLPARDGIGFPLTPDEMKWHLRYFDIPV